MLLNVIRLYTKMNPIQIAFESKGLVLLWNVF